MLTSISPPPGLDNNDTAFSSQGRWADCNNVRFYQGQPQVFGEYVDIGAGAFTFLTNIFPFTRSGTTYLAYGTEPKLFIGAGTAVPSERTPAGLPVGGIANWTFGAWGSTLLACPTGGTLYEQIGTSTAAAVSAAPDNITAMIVTPQRQVLAAGCNEEISTTFNGLCIRGSDLEDYADWTTSSTNNAFEHILDGSGTIRGIAQVGQYVGVWTDNALYLGQFIGDPSQTYRFDKVGDNCGLMSQKALTVINDVAYWLDPDWSLRTWTPGTSPQTVPCPISREFVTATAAYDPAGTIVCYVPKYNEVWICHPAGPTNIAVSLTDGTWFKSDIQIGVMVSDELLFGVGSFSSATFASNGISVWAMDCGRNQTALGPVSWFIRSADQYLDSSQRRMMIRSFEPDFKVLDATGGIPDADVSLTLYCRDRPQSTAVTKGPYTIAAGATKKDLRASGKIVSVRLGGAVADVNRELRIGKLLFDTVPLGER